MSTLEQHASRHSKGDFEMNTLDLQSLVLGDFFNIQSETAEASALRQR